MSIGDLVPSRSQNWSPPVATRPRTSAQFMRGHRGAPIVAGWNPALRDPQVDVEQAWDQSAARSIDLMQNTGWIAGGIEQSTVDVVGADGLKLNAKPSPEALGLDEERTAEWAKLTERRFAAYGNRPYDCDVEATRNFGQMQAAQYKSWCPFGEIVAEFPWRPRPGSLYGSKVRLVSPHRLCRRSEPMTRLIQGVRTDADGMPLSYVFEKPDPLIGRREVELAARDRMARTLILHVLDGAIGTKRGISPMVPVLKVAKQYDQMANAQLMHQIMRSLFVFSIESDRPTDDILQSLLTPQEQAAAQSAGLNPYDAYFAMAEGYYANHSRQIDVGINGRIATPLPGEELKVVSPEVGSSDYRAFATDLLRENAVCLGITYEGMTGDYAGVTFSSIRFAVDNNWRKVLYRRKNIIAPFCQATYENWLEEEIESGGPLAIPGGIDRFHANRAGICNADWKGTPKPVADELKRSNDQKLRKDMGIVSEYGLCEENGDDYEDVLAERQRARNARQKYGEPEPAPPQPSPTADPGNPAYDDGKDNGQKKKAA